MCRNVDAMQPVSLVLWRIECWTWSPRLCVCVGVSCVHREHFSSICTRTTASHLRFNYVNHNNFSAMETRSVMQHTLRCALHCIWKRARRFTLLQMERRRWRHWHSRIWCPSDLYVWHVSCSHLSAHWITSISHIIFFFLFFFLPQPFFCHLIWLV